MQNRRHHALMLLAPLLGSVAGAAQSNEAVFFEEIPRVLTASRLEQTPFEAPAPITVIDRELIEASGFTEIQDLLRLVPGFLVADWPSGSPTVANHGLGDAYGRRVKVLIDGRTVNNPFQGNVHWDDLPVRVDDIDRIEVVRGPHGGAYGTNAFQGVVNIVTRPPRTESGTGVILRGGTNGLVDAGVRVNGETTGGIDWRLSASRRRAHTFDNFHDNPKEAIDRSVVTLQMQFQPTFIDQFRLSAGATLGYNRTGSSADPLDPLRRQDVRDNYLQVAWHRSAEPGSELSVKYFHQDRAERSGWNVDTTIGLVPIDLNLNTQRDEVEIQHTAQLSPKWQTLWGLAARRDTVSSAHYLGSDAFSGTQWELFGSTTWKPVEDLAINLGGTFEHHYVSGKLFSPRVAVNYFLAPESVIRVSAGSAYRAPSVWEAESFETFRKDDRIVKLGYWSHGNVEPERVRFLELGYVGHFPSLGLSADARIYREKYERYIDEQRCFYPPRPSRLCAWAPPPDYRNLRQIGRPDTFFFLNSDGVNVDGAEFRLDWRRPGWGRAVLTQTFIDIDAGTGQTDPDLILSSPSTMTSLLLIKELPHRWQASLAFYHSDAMYWLNQGDVVPTHGRVDLRIAKKFGPIGQENEFSLTFQSVGGDYVEFHEGRFRAEPHAFATLKLFW